MNYCKVSLNKSKSYVLTLDSLLQLSIIIYLFSIYFSISSGDTLVKISRVLVAGFWFVNFLFNISKERTIKLNFYYVWAVLFLLYHASLIILGKAIDSSTSLTFLMTAFYTLFINCIILSYLVNYNDFFWTIIKILPIVAFIGLLRIYFTFGFNYYFDSRGAEVNGNGIGFKGVIGALCALYILIINHKKGKLTRTDILYGILLLSNIVLAILTASRMVFINFGVPIVVYLILKSKNVLKAVRNILIAFLIVILVYLLLMYNEFLYNLVGNRIESMLSGFLGETTDSSTATRLRLIYWGIEFFESNKIWGYGLDGFRSMMKIFHPGYTAYYAHNNFVEMLVAGGVIGFSIYYSLYLIVIIQGIKLLKTKDKTVLFFFGIFIGFVISEYGKITYYETYSQLLAMLCFYVFFINKKHKC